MISEFRGSSWMLSSVCKLKQTETVGELNITVLFVMFDSLHINSVVCCFILIDLVLC